MGKPTEVQTRRWKRALGYRVRLLREEARQSQAEVAEAAGVHPTYLSGVERGLRNVSYTTLIALAHALGTTLSALTDGVDGEAQ